MRHKYKRSGFTLVETLACIAIAGVLAGVALPVLGDATEEARQMACANRLAEITLGSLQYEEANGRMPPLVTGAGPMNDPGFPGEHQHTGALAYILPFIGEQEVFDLMPAIATQPEVFLNPGSSISSFNELLVDPGMAAAFNTQLPSVICPSNADLLDRPLNRLFYRMIQATGEPNLLFIGFFDLGNGPDGSGQTSFGRTSYLPSVGGYHVQLESELRAIDLTIEDTAGAMRNRLTSIPASELGDGASNTICWSESLGYQLQDDIIFGGDTGASFGLFSTALITGQAWAISANEPILFGDADNTLPWTIGSNHIRGSNVTFCDGSVRFISNRTAQGVMASLGCGNDGWVAERSQ